MAEMIANKIFQMVSLIVSFLFMQIASLESELLSEAVKYGFSVIFLLIALVYMWKDWKKERISNDNLHKEFRKVLNMYNSAVTTREKTVFSLTGSIDRQSAAMEEMSENFKRNFENHTKILDQIKRMNDKVDDLSEEINEQAK